MFIQTFYKKMSYIFVPAILATIVNMGFAATGPSSSHDPYLTPRMSGVDFTSILTVGDSVNDKSDGTPYVMVGLADGLGAYDNKDGTFTILINHELKNTQGIPREHNSTDSDGKGAFVSKWIVKKSDLTVLHGEDLIKKVKLWDSASESFIDSTNAIFNRFCSADLPDQNALYNRKGKKGYDGYIFLNGEEVSGGRAFAHIINGSEAGTSYELPSLGKISWENAVACTYMQDKTIVIGLDDGEGIGKVFVYLGMKQKTGNPVERAGLHGGELYGIKVENTPNEDRDMGIAGSTFTLFSYGDAKDLSGTDLQTIGDANGVTNFLRPEDGAWDTKNPQRFYFVTTDRYDQVKDGVGAQVGRSRLWRLTFNNITQPEHGGKIEMLLDGTGPYQMFDNITVDGAGNVLLQEDPGNQAYNAKIWIYRPDSIWLSQIARHDIARFGDLSISATSPFSSDEEFSGIVDVTRLFKKEDGYDTKKYHYFLLDVQAHRTGAPYNTQEIAEGGQLLLMSIPVEK